MDDLKEQIINHKKFQTLSSPKEKKQLQIQMQQSIKKEAQEKKLKTMQTYNDKYMDRLVNSMRKNKLDEEKGTVAKPAEAHSNSPFRITNKLNNATFSSKNPTPEDSQSDRSSTKLQVEHPSILPAIGRNTQESRNDFLSSVEVNLKPDYIDKFVMNKKTIFSVNPTSRKRDQLAQRLPELRQSHLRANNLRNSENHALARMMEDSKTISTSIR